MVVFGDGGIGALEGCFVPSGEPFDTCPTACGMVCKDNFVPQGEPFVTCPTDCGVVCKDSSLHRVSRLISVILPAGGKGDDPKGGRGKSKIRTKVRTSPARS